MLALPATGQVLGADGSPVPYARVAIKETGKAYTTDESGRFTFDVPGSGFYTLRVVADDRLFEMRKEVRQAGERLVINFPSERPPRVEEAGPGAPPSQVVEPGQGIVVQGRRDGSRASRYRLDGDDLKRVPGTMGDKLRAVEILPGVGQAAAFGLFPTSGLSFADNPFDAPYSNSTRGFLTLRGGGSLANGFYLDGFRMAYPFHIGEQSSVVSGDFVRSVDVYMSHIPGRFAGVTGGVIDIAGPSGVERASGRLNLGMFRSDAYFETPLGSSGAGSAPAGFAAVGARKSYRNLVLNFLAPDALPADAKFADYEDGQAKFAYQIAPEHRVEALLFGAGDRLDYFDSGGGRGAVNDRPPVKTDRNFYSGGLRYLYANSRLQNELTLETTGFRENFEVKFTNPFTGETWFEYDDRQEKFSPALRDELTIDLGRNVTMRAGGEYRQNRWFLGIDNLLVNPRQGEGTPDFSDFFEGLLDDPVYRSLFFGDDIFFFQTTTYLEAEIRSGPWRFTPGVRQEYTSLSGDSGTGPALGVEYALTDRLSLLGGAGRYFGVAPLIDQISRTGGNSDLDLEESNLAAGGFEYRPTHLWTLKMEGFRNEYSSLVVEDRFETEAFWLKSDPYILAKEKETIHLDPFENRSKRYSNDGTGDSTGLELFLERKQASPSRGWSGIFSYTYSIAHRNNHQPRFTDEMEEELNNKNEQRDVLRAFEVRGNDVVFYDNGEVEIWPDTDRRELYDLDRTHQANLALAYQFSPEWRLGLRQLYATNTPITPIVWSEEADLAGSSGSRLNLPVYSSMYNSARLEPVVRTDLRIDTFFPYDWGVANLYLDLINLGIRRQAEGQEFNAFLPYFPGVNPSVSTDKEFLEIRLPGRKIYLPLFNAGMEVKF